MIQARPFREFPLTEPEGANAASAEHHGSEAAGLRSAIPGWPHEGGEKVAP